MLKGWNSGPKIVCQNINSEAIRDREKVFHQNLSIINVLKENTLVCEKL